MKPRGNTILLIVAMAAFLGTGCKEDDRAEIAFDVSPDGGLIVFSATGAGGSDLYLLSRKSSNVVQFTKNQDRQETHPVFSPDGKWVAFGARSRDQKASHLFVRSIDGSKEVQLTTDPAASDSFPSYSPDGGKLAFARGHKRLVGVLMHGVWSDWDIYTVNTDGTGLRRLTNIRGWISGLTFSRDGKTLVFSGQAERSGRFTRLFSVSDDGSQPPAELSSTVGLRRKGVGGNYPRFSPDGKWIVFISDCAERYHYDLYRIDIHTHSALAFNATNVSRYNLQPVVTPDGKSVLFLAAKEWSETASPILSLWEVDMTGANPRRVAGSSLFTQPLKWRPGK